MKKYNEAIGVNPNFVEMESKILNFWKEEKIFEKSLEKTKNKKEYIFYDGPPFANGLPHYGHLLTSCAKDVIGRFQTMNERYVQRR
jgi:isoleucyl-tRNA synthetase